MIISFLLTVLGLSVFEIVSSIDNAVINAEVLSTMSQRGKRWFLSWGLLCALVLVRGLIPIVLIIVVAKPTGWWDFCHLLLGNQRSVAALTTAGPYLLSAGGTFLVLLFSHWLFREEKNLINHKEQKMHGLRRGWEGIFSLTILSTALTLWLKLSLGLALVAGILIFLVGNFFKERAASQEKSLMTEGGSDIHKIIYLEIIDAAFSVDGVLGAFAFTFSLPVILLGNGIGGLIVRQLTVKHVDAIKRYDYLKNGAMYSLGLLGILMLVESQGFAVPSWVSPFSTIAIIGYFLLKPNVKNTGQL